ncbi:hypothetical protein BSKO_09742 [Bryopsis sp. KO-2023]|nr:hypothetical protein BSKO_09742 [Bryopsis sp. KO-2023]
MSAMKALFGGRPTTSSMKRSPYSGNVRALRTVKRAGPSGRPMVVRVSSRYPDPAFIDATLDAFLNGDESVANVEQAITLIKEAGYTYLDVRSYLAVDTYGHVPGSVNIPIISASRRWDSEKGDNVVTVEPLDDFIDHVKYVFPDKETKLLVACATGRQYSIDALMALDDEGYENIVGLKGGFNRWTRTFDNNMRRRGNPKYETVYDAHGDGMGIHSTGAGFARVDFVPVVDAEDY